MRVAQHIVQARRQKLASLLAQYRYLPLHELCERLRISEATARRDLAVLAQEKRITRTYGGAIGEFDEEFASFLDRQNIAVTAKRQIACQALSLIKPGQCCFFDMGTTLFALAEELGNSPVLPLQIVTNNLPVAEKLIGIDGVQVHLLGGQLFKRQSILLGEKAEASVNGWRFDLAFLGAEGMTERGIWNSQVDIVRLQRAVMQVTRNSVFCLDSSKLGKRAPEFLISWNRVGGLVTDAQPLALQQAGIRLTKHQLVNRHNKTQR